MAVRVAVVGLGAMGTTHFKAYGEFAGARVVAVCDPQERRLAGDWSAAACNLDTGGARRTDLAGIKTCVNFAAVLADPDVDLVDLCVPTFLHAEMTIAALEAGKHVFCEKPMARTSALARRMIRTAARCGRRLAIGHCLRFWPEYLALWEMIDSGRYGPVRTAHFVRLSSRPQWSWNHWLQDPGRSGSAALDLHIHDADVVRWFFGAPGKVTASAALDPAGGVAHIVTTYHYSKGPVVTAEGRWDLPEPFPFRMGATLVFERAAVEFNSAQSPTLTVYDGASGKVEHPAVAAANAYAEELRYFVECIAAGTPPSRILPAEAAAAVALVEAEVKAALTGRAVKVKA